MTLVRATAAHAPVLAAIHADSFPPAQRWSAAAMGDILGMPGSLGLLHADGGFILARHVAGEAEVLTLAVTPTARRRGIATTLLAAAADAMGAPVLFLEVEDTNAAALALYRGAGFNQCGVRPRYYPDGGNALVLRRGAA